VRAKNYRGKQKKIVTHFVTHFVYRLNG
jgi:hypothetical protein